MSYRRYRGLLRNKKEKTYYEHTKSGIELEEHTYDSMDNSAYERSLPPLPTMGLYCQSIY